MTDHNYKELLAVYQEAAKAYPHCRHAECTTSITADDIYFMNCPTCGFAGWANYATAKFLGWFKDETK